MLRGKIALVGVAAHVERHEDGTRTLILVDNSGDNDVQVIVPFSGASATAVAKQLDSSGIVRV